MFWFLAILLFGCHSVGQTAESSRTASAPSLEEWEVGEHSATTPVARDQAWIDQFWWMKRRAQEHPVDLVFLGDSITHFWAFKGKEVWDEYYGHRNAANFGSGADLTQHVLWRIDHGNFDDISPKLVVVHIGTNNSPHNSPEEIADGVIAIVKRLRQKVPAAKILLLAIFPRGQFAYDGLRKRNNAANEIFRKVADDRHIFYLDIGSRFLIDGKQVSKEAMYDYLHLTPRGYRIWAEAIEEKVIELME